MKIQFDADLETLKHMLMDMAVSVEQMLEVANRSLFAKDPSTMKQVYELENKVNHIEVEIEGYAVTLIARHQPAATDLRFIVSVIKIAHHLERMGDLAINIEKRLPEIAKISLPVFPENLKTISGVSLNMLKKAVAAFVNHDAEKAREVCETDDQVDELNKSLLKLFINDMIHSRMDAEEGIKMVMVAKQYERIGDCATNFAEEIIYYVLGKNIKHHFEKEENAKLREMPDVDVVPGPETSPPGEKQEE